MATDAAVAARYLPAECTEQCREKKGKAVDAYVSVMPDPRGGDLPGARSALIGWIVLDRKGDVHNWVDDTFSKELKAATEVMRKRDVDVVAVISTKPAGFCAGISLEETYPLTDQAEISKHIVKARAAFAEVQAIHCPSIAFVHGTCVGAGFELALMCTMRMAAEGSRVGFPDVKQGVIPALGGMAALPEVIGLKASMNLIAHGQVLGQEAAYDTRLVDFLLPYPRHQVKAYKEIASLIWDCVTRAPTISLKRGCFRRDLWMERTIPGKFYLKHSNIAALDATFKGAHPAPYVALSALMTSRYSSAEAGEAAVMGAATCLGASSWGKTFIRLRSVGAKLSDNGKQRIEAAKAAAPAGARDAMEAEETRRRALVVVGSTSDIAVVLGVALRRGGFCMLGARRARDRIEIIEKISSAVDNETLQEHLPRLHRTDSFAAADCPNASGYSVVGIVYDPSVEGEDEGVRDAFLQYLDNEEKREESWLWALADKAIPPPQHTNMVIHSSFYMAAGYPLTADMELPADPAVLTAATKKLLGYGASILVREAGAAEKATGAWKKAAKGVAFPDAMHAGGAVDLAVLALYRAAVASGGSLNGYDSILSMEEGTLAASLSSGAVRRLALDCDALPTSTDHLDAKADKFLMLLCNGLVEAAAAAAGAKAGMEWATLDSLDVLFVTALCWPASVCGPCALFDKRRLFERDDLKEYPALQAFVKAHGRLLPTHPLPNLETDRAAWKLADSYTVGPQAVSMYDLIWPVLAYCLYWLILTTPGYIAGIFAKDAKRRRGHMKIV